MNPLPFPGTELRVAETYAHMKGRRLRHAVVIGCPLEPSDYGKRIEVVPLVNLREARPEVTYRFLKDQA